MEESRGEETILAISLKQVASGERVFVDSDGRQRVLHGVNAVVKGPPWIPSTMTFSPTTSLSKRDMAILKSLGLNMIRLGVMWPGLQPHSADSFDDSYFEKLDLILQDAAYNGIYVLLDMHQDVISELFCGEGIPLWAANLSVAGLFNDRPNKLSPSNFPAPLGLPFQDQDLENSTGFWLPTRQACQRAAWGDYYFSEAASQSFQSLYVNRYNLTQLWGRALAEVAKRFQNRPEVLGIELINEPWAGDIYQYPELLLPGDADHRTLQPAYQIVASEIRKTNDDVLLFFEGTTWSDTGFGFTEVPGGPDYQNRSVVSFHFYIPPQFPNSEEYDFAVHIQNARNLQCGYMLTEFGGLSDAPFFVNVTKAADDNLLSWSVWEWKNYCEETNQTLNSPSQWAAFGACKTGYGGVDWVQNTTDNSWAPSQQNQMALARAYPTAVAGNITSYSFQLDPDTLTPGNFQLVFDLDLSCTLPTEIYLSIEWFFQSFDVTVHPPESMKISHLSNSNYVHATPTNQAAQGDSITIIISPSSSSPSS